MVHYFFTVCSLYLQCSTLLHKPEVEGQRWRDGAMAAMAAMAAMVAMVEAFLRNNRKQECLVHLDSVIYMYTMYKMYKDVALSRSSFGIFLECRDSLLLLVT